MKTMKLGEPRSKRHASLSPRLARWECGSVRLSSAGCGGEPIWLAYRASVHFEIRVRSAPIS